jgi:hypothetical protein
MLKEIYENDLGIMEGTFYSKLFGYDLQVRYAKNIPVEYIEKNIQYFNCLEPSILRYVRIGTYKFDEYDIANENIPVLNLRGDCAWSGDRGIAIVAKNNQLLYVGTWKDLNVWDNRVESRLERMFNYAVSKDA